MSRAWQPGQLLFCGYEGLEPPRDLIKLIADGRVGGVILFARNIESPQQLRRVTRQLADAGPSSAPLAIAVDQEGGRVQRMRKPWTEWPPMAELGRQNKVEDTRAFADALATELRDFGFNLDFAPVVDVHSQPNNPVIGDRSFGPTPEIVSEHACAVIEALQKQGVAACAKHFPGHGDTTVDSHLDLPVLDHGLQRLEKLEFGPFRAAISAEVASIMSAHILFPQLDAKRPATLSPTVMGLLRERLGYEGLVFSDDLEMGAVAKHYSPRDRILGCLEAGIDSPLVCRHADFREEAVQLLESASDGLLEAPLTRMVKFKQRLAPAGPRQDAGAPPYEDHLRLAQRLART